MKSSEEKSPEPSSRRQIFKLKTLNILTKLSSLIKLPFRGSKKKNISKADTEIQKNLNNLKFSLSSMTESEKEILLNLFKFGEKNISQIIVPRSDICGIDIDKSIKELSNLVIENGHTRTIIYSDSLDNIEGFVHIRDLFKTIHQGRDDKIRDILRKPVIAAPSMKLVDLLAEMQKKRTHISVVLDEYGGTLGIVTIEDIMEEIFGRIQDEHDAEFEEDQDYYFTQNGDLVASARVSIEDIEELLKCKFKNEDDDIETIGGLVLARAGFLPRQGEAVDIGNKVFAKVIQASPRSIKKVKLIISE